MSAEPIRFNHPMVKVKGDRKDVAAFRRQGFNHPMVKVKGKGLQT